MILPGTLIALAGTALISGDVPETERVKKLEKYFSPRPGTELRVDDHVLKEFGKKDRERGLVYGEITVTPPKGHCLTITKFVDQSDIEVCKRTNLRWRMQDLDRSNGRLNWKVSTGSGDFGTRLQWKTAYIIAKTIPAGFEFYEANSSAVFIKSCDAVAADPENFRGRRILLGLVNGDTWTIRFPDKDVPLPPYEPPPPPPPPEDEKKKKAGDGHGEEPPVDEHGAAKKVEAAPKTPPPPSEDWTLSTRRGYVMDVSNVIVGSATAPGTKGKCRYQYDGTIGDYDTGRIECHYGDTFLYLYSSLPCMKFIMPPAAKGK